MAYGYGQATSHRLKAENQWLTDENRRLTAELARERNKPAADEAVIQDAELRAKNLIRLARNDRDRAKTVIKNAAKDADRITAAAQAQASNLLRAAEEQASLICERAYDKGWALADRDYLDAKVRQADERRARESTLRHLRLAS